VTIQREFDVRGMTKEPAEPEDRGDLADQLNQQEAGSDGYSNGFLRH
jgi:hypothetical protein